MEHLGRSPPSTESCNVAATWPGPAFLLNLNDLVRSNPAQSFPADHVAGLPHASSKTFVLPWRIGAGWWGSVRYQVAKIGSAITFPNISSRYTGILVGNSCILGLGDRCP